MQATMERRIDLAVRSSGSLLFCLVGIVLMMVLVGIAPGLYFTDIITFVSIDVLFVISLFYAFGFAKGNLGDSFYVVLIPWGFLLIDDALFSFNRFITLDNATQGEYKPMAYGETSLWILASLFMALLSAPFMSSILRRLFTGANKWITMYIIYSIISIAWTVQPLFSLAWAFKLCIVVWILAFSAFTRGTREIKAFLKFSLFMFCMVMVISVMKAVIDPTDSFQEGRLAGVVKPTDTSETAGLALILCFALYHLDRKKIYLVLASLASVVLVLGGGKTAAGATLIACSMFLLAQKRLKTLVFFILGLAVLAIILLETTPIGQYYAHYEETKQGETLTGRTALWENVVGEIESKPLFGHGYMSQRFYSFSQTGANKDWTTEQINQMHDAYLSVMYDLGVIGLSLILTMIFITGRNLWRAWKERIEPEVRLLVITFLAIFVNLLVDSCLSTPFGGRPFGFFMMFLACVTFSHVLRHGLRSNPLSHTSSAS